METANGFKAEIPSFEDHLKRVLGEAGDTIAYEHNPDWATHYPGLYESGVKWVSKMVTTGQAEGQELAGRYDKKISLIAKSQPKRSFGIEYLTAPDREGLQEKLSFSWDPLDPTRAGRQEMTHQIISADNNKVLHQGTYTGFGEQAIAEIERLINEYKFHNISDDRVETDD